MPKFEENKVDYNEFCYKNYLWKENGRFVKPEKTVTQYRAKQKRKRVFDPQGAFVATVIVLCFIITFVLADIVSGGSFLSLVSQNNGGTDNRQTNYYALALDYYVDESIASMTADELRQLGGGGYVLFDKGYYLIASVYGNSADAEAVLERLKSQSARIYKITVKEPELNWCSKDEKKQIKNALTYADLIYNDLYAISCAIDNGKMSEYEARAEIKVLLNKITNLKADFEKTAKNSNIKITKVNVEIAIAVAMLDNLLNNKLPRYNLVSDVRYTYTAILIGYKNLLDNIN